MIASCHSSLEAVLFVSPLLARIRSRPLMVDPPLDVRTGQWTDGLWVVFFQAFLVQKIPTIKVWVTSLVHGNDLDWRHAALGCISSAVLVLKKVMAVFNGLIVDYGGGLAVVGDGGCAATLVVDGGGKAYVGVVSFWVLGLVLGGPSCSACYF